LYRVNRGEKVVYIHVNVVVAVALDVNNLGPRGTPKSPIGAESCHFIPTWDLQATTNLHTHFMICEKMANKFAVKSLDHLVLTVRSIPRTVAWYTTYLGMRHEIFTSPLNQAVQRYYLPNRVSVSILTRKGTL
jgi:hypothetical protein